MIFHNVLHRILLCLQPTYEELKPFFPLPNGCLGAESLQPTYEELKPFCATFGAVRDLGLQPTYEELKHHIQSHPLIGM